MSLDDPFAGTDLVRSLSAIGRTQRRWLADLQLVCAERDPCFKQAFRRWEEWLTLIKLHIHRAEGRLLHYLLVPEDQRPWRDLPGPQPERQRSWRRWYDLVAPYLRELHLDTTYRRLADIRDPTSEAINADIVTDLVAVAEVAESTNLALAQVSEAGRHSALEELAFFHILSPWKQQGLPALFDLLRWLHAFLAEYDEL